MIDVEPIIESELDRMVQAPKVRSDWPDVQRRAAGMGSRADATTRVRRRRLAIVAGLASSLAIAGALVGVAVTAQSPPPVTKGFSALDDPSLPRLTDNPDPSVPVPYRSVLDMFRALGPGPYDGRRVGPGMYLARRGDVLCRAVIEGDSGCTDRLDGDVWFGGTQRRAYDASTAPFDVDFYGFARDDVSAIRVTFGASELVDLPVRHDAFRTTLEHTTFAEIRAITVVYADGKAREVDPASAGFAGIR